MAVAAYSSLVSLMHVLDNVQHPARRHRLHLDRKQIGTLQEKVRFLQDFLEVHSQRKSHEMQDLAMQISVVADEAEDIIDLYVVDQLCEGPKSRSQDMSILSSFCQDINKVIEKLDFVKREFVRVLEEERTGLQGQKPVSSPPACSSTVLPSDAKNSTMVGFDERLERVMDELTGHKSDLQILPIVGMGGIGKTTLAKNVSEHPYIVHRFDMRIWFTISQKYNAREILVHFLIDGKNQENNETLAELGERLYKSLCCQKYLIVMDDVWSTDVWDDLKRFFPNNRNGSRILVTTRLFNVAVSLGSQSPYIMEFLDESKSWDLFCEKAFSKQGCPFPELEKIGKYITKCCRGLPLAIVVIGGLLANSKMTLEDWEFVAENVSSYANLGNDEHCLKVLYMSYNNLALHLKPCFLYMGVFPEDHEIKVSELIKLWVAEGFLKPIRDKSLEEAAEEYLRDLIDRNLILIRKLGCRSKIKTCCIHDFLRDLCLRESRKEQPFHFPKVQLINFRYHTRGCFLCSRYQIKTSQRVHLSQVLRFSRSAVLSRPLVCHVCRIRYPKLIRLRSVMVMDTVDDQSFEEFQQPTGLRYLSLQCFRGLNLVYPSPIPLLWNLQILIVDTRSCVFPIILPSEIWEMPQLRHLKLKKVVLPDPVVVEDSTILENLQTLSFVLNFRCTTNVLERLPNLKKLEIFYDYTSREWSYYCLYNLPHLHKLESLLLQCERFFLKNMTFPHTLKTLTLKRCGIPWEDITAIGSLPNLEVLKLYYNGFKGHEWNPVEGEFLRLRFLLMKDVDVVSWGADKTNFPNLESLVLEDIINLKEIPSGIGEIETLHSIHLVNCSDCIINSAKHILEEQQSLGIEALQVHVQTKEKYDEMVAKYRPPRH